MRKPLLALSLIAALMLTACQPTAGADQSATLAPTADASDLSMPCPADQVLSQINGNPQSGYPTPEEAFDALTERPSGTPTRFDESEFQVVWVFVDDQGRKTGQVRVARFNVYGWSVLSTKFCAGELSISPTLYTTPAPAPLDAAEAAAMPLNCAGAMSEGSVSDYGYDPNATPTGPFTPEEALAEYAKHEHVFSDTPSYAHITETRAVWVYLNDEGRIVQKLRGELISQGVWVVSGHEACFPLE